MDKALVETNNTPAISNGPESFITLAIEKNVPVETLERLLALRDKIQADNARDMFFRALSLFQSKCPVIPKEKTAGNGNFTYKYAPLEVIVKHIGPLLNECGLSFTFDTEDTESDKTTICTVHHIAGHSEKSRFKVPIDKTARMNDTQKQGSAGTYAKRYALCNALGILTGDEDDDGAHATPGAAGQPQPQTTKQPEQPKAPASAPSAPQPQPTNGQTAKGFVVNITPLACKKTKPTDPDKFRYKVELKDHAKPFYTFDKKIRDYLDKHAVNGEATINFEVGRYGQDIKSVSFDDPNTDFAKFCEEQKS